MNKTCLYLYGMLIAILCFSTTVPASEREITGYGPQWAAPVKTQAHNGVMLAGGATELKPRQKRSRGSTSPAKNLSVNPNAEKKMEKKKPIIQGVTEEIKKSRATLFAPNLEVKELSGDFVKWSKSIVRNSPESLTFRWWLSNAGIAKKLNIQKAKWEIREGGQLKTSGFLPSIPQAGHFQEFPLKYFKNVPSGKHTYTVRIMLFDNRLKQVGKPSNAVTITFQPAPMEVQRFNLDTLKVLSIQPSVGTVTGPPAGTMLDSQNSIEITYRYDLVSKDTAYIEQALLRGNKVVSTAGDNNRAIVYKGFAKQAKARAAIPCKFPKQYDKVVTGIKYRLYYIPQEGYSKNQKITLVEGIKTLPNLIHFRCPKSPPGQDNPPPPKTNDYLYVSVIKPPSVQGRGASPTVIHGAKQGEPLNQSNSIKISYRYNCTYPKCNIRQVEIALLSNGQTVSLLEQTDSVVEQGDGWADNRLTVRCLSNKQPDTLIKGIRYHLFTTSGLGLVTGGGSGWLPIASDKAGGVHQVNYLFTCKDTRKKKASQLESNSAP